MKILELIAMGVGVVTAAVLLSLAVVAEFAPQLLMGTDKFRFLLR